MSTADDLVLLTTDPSSGKSRLDSLGSDAVLGGAILTELIAAGRVRLGEGKRAKAEIVDSIADPVQQAGFARVSSKAKHKPADIVRKLGKGAKNRVYDELVAAGALTRRDETVLFIPVKRYDVLDTARRAKQVESVRAVLVAGQEPDAFGPRRQP
jgi:hypothetical protein